MKTMMRFRFGRVLLHMAVALHALALFHNPHIGYALSGIFRELRGV